MFRRSSAVIAAAACLLSPAVVGAEDPPAAPAPELPRLNCARRIIDVEGDGYTNPGGALPGAIATSGLDIVSVFMRSTADELQMQVRLKDLPPGAEMKQYDGAYRYKFFFKLAGKEFYLHYYYANPQFSTRPWGNNPTTYGSYSNGPARGGADAATDVVWVAVPRAWVEEKSAESLANGVKLTDINVRAEWWAPTAFDAHSWLSDEAKPTGDAATWAVGDDYCYGPPPATLSDVTAVGVQHTDVSTLSAKLVDEAGAAIAGATVRFKIGSLAPISATAGADGIATATYTAELPTGTYPVAADFPGTATAGKAAATGSLTIRNEVTKFDALAVKKTSATARSVTAVLRDDDNKPLASQKVGWYVNGKLVSTLTTDASGKSVFNGAKGGQTVQARFAGVTGKFVASKSNIPKV
ncbi:MAG TPA: Ig-like domain-containing protein [Frankiaceae bacterium]|nr:Ig-like domain-containing protein [Frankiaceae bacterium]